MGEVIVSAAGVVWCRERGLSAMRGAQKYDKIMDCVAGSMGLIRATIAVRFGLKRQQGSNVC